MPPGGGDVICPQITQIDADSFLLNLFSGEVSTAN